MTDKKRKGRPKADDAPPWDQIEEAYVQGHVGPDGHRVLPSFSDLGRRFGLSPESISRRASLGNWTEKRQEFTSALAEKVREKVVSTMAVDLFSRVKVRAELGEMILGCVRAALSSEDVPGVALIEPQDLQRLQAVLKAQAECDRIDLTLDPSRGAEKPKAAEEAAGDPDTDAALDALVDSMLAQNQAPADGGANPAVPEGE